MFNVDVFDQDSDYIIFDACDPVELKQTYKAWIGGKDEVYIEENGRVETIEWGKPCIWLSNDDPRNYQGWDWEYVDANAVVIHLTHNLYVDSSIPLPSTSQQL